MFAGWNTSSDGSGTSHVAASTFTMGSADVILYAQWTLTPTAIPDDGLGVASIVVDTGPSTISTIVVTINVTHADVSQLNIVIKPPMSLFPPSYPLVTTLTGVSGANFVNTVIDPDAAQSIASGTAPYTGTFSGESNIAANLFGESPLGVWTLQVYDTVSGVSGTIDSWSIQID